MILNSLKCKADDEADDEQAYDEADDEPDGLQNKYVKLMELEKKLSFIERDISAKKKTKLVTQECEDRISGVLKGKGKVEELQNKYKSMGCDEPRNKKKGCQDGSSQDGSSGSRTSLSKSMADERFGSRTSLSKSMADERFEPEYQLEKGSNIGILVGKFPERVIKMSGPGPEDKPFLLPIVEDILGHLGNEREKRIGLWGDAEIVRTTIMKSLNNNERAAEMFDIIIWVPASEDLDFNGFQHKIAARLNLSVEGITNSEEIYHQIRRELKGKRYLLLLDKASGSFDLSWVRYDENEEGGKVVLTASSRRFCLQMGTDFDIRVGTMSNAVAWEIFKKRAGRNVDLPLFRPIAEQVAIACGGSLHLIHKVASKFIVRESLPEWEEGLRILQNWPGADIDDIDKLLST